VLISLFRIRLMPQIPGRAMEGDEVGLQLTLWNKGWLPRFICKAEIVLFGVGSVWDEQAKKRGKAARLQMFHRFSAGSSIFDSQTYEMNGAILRSGRQRIRRTLELSHRGEIRIKCLKLYLADPLGIFSIPKKYPVEETLLVRVKPCAGEQFSPFTGGGGHLDTQMHVGETGELSEFGGTRLYREGDELRHIHWPTVARRGELYVREYTQTAADSVMLLCLRNPEKYGTPEWKTPPSGEFLLRSLATSAIEFFNRRIHVTFGTNIGEGGGFSIGYSSSALQRFHCLISAFDWEEQHYAPLESLRNIIPPGQEQSGVIVFCIDEPSSDYLSGLPSLMRIASNRFLVVTTRVSLSTDSPDVPEGMRLLECENEDAEEFFRKLSTAV